MKIIFAFVFIVCWEVTFAQGNIDHIKNQPYMRNAEKVDCDDQDGDHLSEKICANKNFQKSDSLLTVVYKELLSKQTNSRGRNEIIELQKSWRKLRDSHCNLIFKQYEAGQGHTKWIIYLNCLKELTDFRIKELESMLNHFQ
jgi:uncharacterized protein YecT (DUF1311 family)